MSINKVNIELPAKVKSWLVTLFLCLGISISNAQTEKVFTEFPEHEVYALAETYDNALLLLVQHRSEIGPPCFIIKYTLEGKELWRQQLNGIPAFKDIISTRDSGFATCGFLYQGKDIYEAASDSLDAVILKFDKCGNLQWSKYIEAPGYQYAYQLFEGNEGNIFFLTGYINGSGKDVNDNTIVVFDKKGKLLNYASYPGNTEKIFPGKNKNEMYLAQLLYLHYDNNPDIVSAFSGVMKINDKLETIARTVVGLREGQKGLYGAVVPNGNEVICLTNAFIEQPKIKLVTMFTRLDTLLRFIPAKPVYHQDSLYNISSNNMFLYGDSLITCGRWNSESVIRIYNTKFQLLKEERVKPDQASYNRMLSLRGNKLVVSLSNHGLPGYSSIFLYDRNLNRLTWSGQPPAKGYDWACTDVTNHVIDVKKVATPVYVPPDTTIVNWGWIDSLEDSPQGIEEMSKGIITDQKWLVWPQPAINSQKVFFRSPEMLIKELPMQAKVYSVLGSLVFQTTAHVEGHNLWSLELQNLEAGIYFVELTDSPSAPPKAKLKVLVE